MFRWLTLPPNPAILNLDVLLQERIFLLLCTYDHIKSILLLNFFLRSPRNLFQDLVTFKNDNHPIVFLLECNFAWLQWEQKMC